MFPPPRTRNIKVKKRNYRPLLFAAAGVLAVLLVFFGARLLFGATNKKLNPVQLSFGTRDAYTATSEAILSIKGSTLSAIDYKNNAKWSANLLTEGMKVSASEHMSAAYDATRVQMFSADGATLASKEFYGTITQVRCGKTLVAVLNTDFENKNRVILLDKAGNEVQKYEFKGKYILDFGFYSEDSFYLYMLDSVASVPVSRLMTYNNTLANTGNLTVENQVLQHLDFLPNSLYAVGTNQIIHMDFVGARLGEKLIYGWEYRGVIKGKTADTFLLVPGGEQAGAKMISAARLLSIGASDVFVQMPTGTMAVSVNGNWLYAYTAKKLRRINLKGEISGDYQLPFTATAFVPLPTQKHALCMVGDTVYLVKLP